MPVHAINPKAEVALLPLRQVVLQLTDSNYAEDPVTAAAVRKLRDQAAEFQEWIQDKPGNDGRYAEAVHYLTGVIGSITAAPDAQSALAILDDANDDLGIKLAFIHSREGVAVQERGLVTVTIQTIRVDQPVRGLIVYCNPYRWKNDKRQFVPFAKASTPTDAAMVPGRYRCFAAEAVQDGLKNLASKDMRVGFDGKDAAAVDIVIP